MKGAYFFWGTGCPPLPRSGVGGVTNLSPIFQAHHVLSLLVYRVWLRNEARSHSKSLPDPERLAQVAEERLPLFRVSFGEDLEPPLNGGQRFDVRDTQQFPLGSSFPDGEKEPAVFLGHTSDEFLDEFFPRAKQVAKCNSSYRHPLKSAREFLGDIEAHGRENLRHGPVVAEDVNQEGLSQGWPDSLVYEKVADIGGC